MAATPAESMVSVSSRRFTADAAPSDVEQDRQEFEGGTLEDNSNALPVSVAERLSRHGSGEWQERDVHQQHGVQEEHHAVDTADVVEHDVVVGPHLADQHERKDVRQVGRPERGQAVHQVARVMRRADLQHKQRDGDGDDAVAEGDHPGRIALHAERRRSSSRSIWSMNRLSHCPNLRHRTLPPAHLRTVVLALQEPKSPSRRRRLEAAIASADHSAPSWSRRWLHLTSDENRAPAGSMRCRRGRRTWRSSRSRGAPGQRRARSRPATRREVPCA
ncbi:hypothetical protein FB563_6207 [Streptomyces puniciscabiei]|uniref:Uncharacterized protein n=1 Tax=Streptomyces puniciscabiei TaxID=164348 RepID=A0A542TH26_9ACTN|nr:hypothetical protein FB563_6207 [Streptomyces puniciscabiei]